MTSHRLIAALLTAVLLSALTGCSIFPSPPAEAVALTSSYEATIRGLPGVADATAQVRAVDEKDKPGQFFVSLVVTAANADDLATLPDLIAGVESPPGFPLHATLNVPAAPGVAAVALEDSQDTERAQVLRALPIVESVRLSASGDSVQVASRVALPSAVSTVRESGVLTSDPLDSVAIHWEGFELIVSVSMAGPSDALVDAIQDLRPRVDRVSSSEPSEYAARPVIIVDASSPATVATALAAVVGDEMPGRPRTAFRIHSDTDSVTGYVGLPLGSPEPDDLAAAEPVPTPADTAARKAQIAADTEILTAFLVDAAAASGIPGTPQVFAGECSNGGTASQVQGTLMLPVFEYTDSATPAYDAVTKSWTASGFSHSDQAMGTAIFTPDSAQRIALTTIRGTGDGILITAMAACVR